MSKTVSINKHQKLNSSDYCNTRNATLDIGNLFFKTAQGMYGLKKEALDLFVENSLNKNDKLFLQLAFESGARINELISIRKSDLQGNIISVKNSKKHNENDPLYRDILISDELVYMIHECDKGLLLDRSDRYYRKLCKQYHKDLTPHVFRRGMAQWMKSIGASNDMIAARLGHKDMRTLPHYLKVANIASNDFMKKVFDGIDTRKIQDLSVDEFKNILSGVK